ncbi:MAG: transcription antitermination factor NusB [Elusimicrobiota bacterium]|jgi:N utilization substance protein B|nr:transcription antitermination factor NusB [Elusimicrobiota bacterium]
MGSRRQSRENALQMLYSADNFSMDRAEVLECFQEYLPKEDAYRDFCMTLFVGVLENQKVIDKLIAKYAQNWDMDRMAVVDRNILRLSAYEIIFMSDTPINVIIDEAVEISKQYSTKDSSKFVNGILDKLKTSRIAPVL